MAHQHGKIDAWDSSCHAMVCSGLRDRGTLGSSEAAPRQAPSPLGGPRAIATAGPGAAVMSATAARGTNPSPPRAQFRTGPT
jgi:hypothetical protein